MLNEQLKTELDQEAKSSAADFNYFPGSDECEDLESAYTTGATKYAMQWQEAQQLVERYEKALKEIAAHTGGLIPQKHEMIAIAREALTPKTGSDE